MKLSKAIEKVSGLRFLIDELEIISPPARRLLYNITFMTDEREILTVLNETDEIYSLVRDKKNDQIFSFVKIKLMQVKDILGTINYIKSTNVKDDIEFFEIKHFALLSQAIREYTETLNIKCIQIPDITELIQILDPENKRIPSFYIYDSYSEELANIRKLYKEAKAKGDDNKAEEIKFNSIKIEDDIRKKLSDKIRPFADKLYEALENVAKLDLLIAKSYQITKFELNRPNITKEKVGFKGLFNPQINDMLKSENKKFQPVNIDVVQGVTLIVGANMAGKSVLLKSVALTYYLAQFGFYVPCKGANINPVEEIFISIGDGQNELKGLSSFGAEMLQLNEIIEKIENNKKIIVLLDELARTTNPTEGKAIVSGMVELLNEQNIMALVTTHYGGLEIPCKRLRVKGFREDKIVGDLSTKNINDYMDYELIDDISTDVPHEAIRIAEILKVSPNLIERTKKFLDK